MRTWVASALASLVLACGAGVEESSKVYPRALEAHIRAKAVASPPAVARGGPTRRLLDGPSGGALGERLDRVLDDHYASLCSGSLPDAPRLGIVYSPWSEVRSRSLSLLFPRVRFFAVAGRLFDPETGRGLYSETAGAGSLQTMVAIEGESVVKRFTRWGDQREYAELLAARAVEIRSSDDALTVGRGLLDLLGLRRELVALRRPSGAWWIAFPGSLGSAMYVLRTEPGGRVISGEFFPPRSPAGG